MMLGTSCAWSTKPIAGSAVACTGLDFILLISCPSCQIIYAAEATTEHADPDDVAVHAALSQAERFVQACVAVCRLFLFNDLQRFSDLTIRALHQERFRVLAIPRSH